MKQPSNCYECHEYYRDMYNDRGASPSIDTMTCEECGNGDEKIGEYVKMKKRHPNCKNKRILMIEKLKQL